MSRFIAAIDQGTTSTRCMLFDHAGHVVGRAQREHAQIYPRPGWVEHDPLEIWERTQELIRRVLEESRIRSGEIVAIGITNQRETTLVWNKYTGEPYGNAIVWQDTRTKEVCERLGRDGGQDRFRARVGLPLATYFSGPKLMWCLENIEGLRDAAESGTAIFGTIDSWLIWWLTGGPEGGAHVTDVTNASRTMMMDLETLGWDDEILEVMDIPPGMLPVITPSSDPASWGMTSPGGPFAEGIPVCGNLGDQQAALVGQVCFDAGQAKNTYGTGCFLLMNTGSEVVHSKNGLLTTLAYKFGESDPVYALEGSIAITGALVQWLRDNLGMISSASQIENLASAVDDNGDMYIVPAFSGLFAPYWRADARGVIAGLTRYITREHFARAALEATAYQTRDVVEAMEQDSGVELELLKVDGGMVVNDLLMQFQADILDVEVIRPRIAETTSLGAAYAAGIAAGFWDDLEQVRTQWAMDQAWKPAMDEAARAGLYQGWKKAVTRTFDWVE
jgi:glycerol kinase